MSTHAQTTYTHRVNADPRGADGQIRCPAHGDIAVKLTSHTPSGISTAALGVTRTLSAGSLVECLYLDVKATLIPYTVWADDPKLNDMVVCLYGVALDPHPPPLNPSNVPDPTHHRLRKNHPRISYRVPSHAPLLEELERRV